MVAIFPTCLINSIEHQEVDTVNIPGTFIQSDIYGETVHMKLEGKMEDLLTKLYQKLYCKYVTNEKLTTILYVEL